MILSKKLFFAGGDNDGCYHYRSKLPARFLGMESSPGYKIKDSLRDDCDIVILERATNPYFLEEIPRLQSQGKKVLYDIDDNLWNIPSSNKASSAYTSKILKETKAIIKLCDGMVVSTAPLKEFFIKENFHDNIHEIPNFLEDVFPDRAPSDQVTVAFCGTDCYDEETEILTEEGWKFFKDLNRTEKVATLNPETNQLEYHLPSEYVDKEFIGDMYLCNNKNIDFCVTGNHNIYASLFDYTYNKKLNYKFHEMRDISNSNFYIKRDCIYIKEDVEYFILPSVQSTESASHKIVNYPDQKIEMDDWLKFFGFWVTEGWCSTLDKNKLMQIGLAQHKKNNYLKEIEDIAIKYNWKYSYAKEGTNLRIFNRQLWSYLTLFGKAVEKFIPTELLNVSKRQLEILFSWMINGNGHVEKNGRIRFISSSKKLIDNMSEIVLKLGKYSSIVNRGKMNGKIKGKDIIANYDNYMLSVSNKKFDAVVRPNNISKIDYSGRIYCVTVPYHTLYVRRNGKAMWCGNTHKGDFDFRLVDALRSLKGKCRLVFVGYNPIPGFEDEFIKWVPVDDYLQTLYNLNIDIAVAPLQDIEFNKCKSNLKWLEFSSMGTCFVGSDVYPYSNSIVSFLHGVLINDTKKWKPILDSLIDDAEKRSSISSNAKDTVNLLYTYKNNGQLIIDLYEEVIKSL